MKSLTGTASGHKGILVLMRKSGKNGKNMTGKDGPSGTVQTPIKGPEN